MKNLTLKRLLFSAAFTGFAAAGMQAQSIALTGANNEEADAVGIKSSEGIPMFADFDNNGYMDIYASGQTFEYLKLENDEDWTWHWYDGAFLSMNNGDGSFTTKDRNAGTGLPIAYGGKGSIALDFNQDGYTDLLYLSWGNGKGWTGMSQEKVLLMINNGDGTFTQKDDAALASFNFRYNHNVTFHCLSVADYNKDGYPDALVQFEQGEPWERAIKLLKNVDGDHFEVADGGFIPQCGGCVSFGDFNNDGWPDIVVTGWADGNDSNREKFGLTDGGNQMHFYRNNQKGGFEFATGDLSDDVTAYGKKYGFGDDAVLYVLDYDQDGKQDILCIGGVGGDQNGQNEYATNGKRSLLLRNVSTDDKLAFEEYETHLYPSSGTGSRMSLLADFNGDGWPDLISCGWNGDWHTATSSSKGAYDQYDINDNFSLPVWSEGWMAFGDINNDGLLDVIHTNNNDRIGYNKNTTEGATVQTPGMPTDLKAVYNNETKTINVTWTGSATESGSKAFYNLYLKNMATGKTFMIAPADAATGKQRAYSPFSMYVPCMDYTFENVADGTYEIGVQAVTYNYTASQFTTTEVATKVSGATINVTAITPENNAEIETATTFTITFDQPVALNTAEDAPQVIFMGRMNMKQVPATLSMVEDTDNQVLVTLNEEVSEKGMYTLMVPEKVVFNADGDWNAAISDLVYTILGKAITTETYIPESITPAEGEYTSLKEFTLTFKEGTFVVDNSDLLDPVYLLNNADNSMVLAEFEFSPNEFNIVKIVLKEEVTAAGAYTLVVPARKFQQATDEWGSVILDNAPELIYNFTIADEGDGIAAILADNTKSDVYTVNGTLVLKNANRAALKALKKGIYVINGKKVVVE